MFAPDALPLPGELLLITDELLAPADFLLHRHLAAHLKESKSSKCVLVSVSEDIGRWKAVAQRSVRHTQYIILRHAAVVNICGILTAPSLVQNLNLTQNLDTGALTFLDAMSFVSPSLDERSDVPLKSLYQKIKKTLDDAQNGAESTVSVVLDDIAALEWIGISITDISRFSRALSALCRKLNASLVLRYHVTTPGEPDDVLRHLLQLCAYHMDVFPLSSGRSGTVSGQVALHCGPSIPESQHRLVTRSSAVQYRLTDVGSIFFDRGTGSGVL
ncbi:hypothetical protein C8Q79DRAFT_791633 [Trametes meyenii]|nr:hypothetical protein C8Q79DRAFT_791633 [Trametes meyenii]